MQRCLVLLLGLSASALGAADGAAVFENNCVACHGADGRAQTPQGRKLKAKDLKDCRLDDAELERQIREGSRVKTGKAVMPGFGGALSDEEVRAVVAYVKKFRE